MNTKLSIIVPIYNGEKFLSCCIDSILSQSFTDFELLLVDDGSEDNSGKICDGYALKDRRIRVIHQTNSGVTFARKTGVEYAKGEYVCFVDADDYLHDYYVKDLYQNADKIITGGVICATQSGMMLNGSEFIQRLLCKTLNWGMHMKLYHRSLFEHDVLNTSRDIYIGEDLITNIKIGLLTDKVVFIRSDGYVYRENPDSATHTRKYSLAYEEMFMKEVENALKGRKSDFKDELWLFKLRCWKNMVLNDVFVDKNRSWVQWILKERSNQKIGLGDKILLNVSNLHVAYSILKVLSKCRKILKRKN